MMSWMMDTTGELLLNGAHLKGGTRYMRTVKGTCDHNLAT